MLQEYLLDFRTERNGAFKHRLQRNWFINGQGAINRKHFPNPGPFKSWIIHEAPETRFRVSDGRKAAQQIAFAKRQGRACSAEQ